MEPRGELYPHHANRRTFLKHSLLAASTATVGAGLLARGAPVFGEEDEESGRLTAGGPAILRFLAAAEIIERDLWVQYNELGGIQDNELPELGGGGRRTHRFRVRGATASGASGPQDPALPLQPERCSCP